MVVEMNNDELQRLFLFKSKSSKGLDDVMENGPWMIRNCPIILKKWSMDTCLCKEELTCIPVRLDQVVIALASGDRGQGFNSHSLQGRMSFSTFGRTKSSLSTLSRSMALYISTSLIHRAMGRSSFARCLIEIDTKDVLKESLTMCVPLIEGTRYTIETVSSPPTIVTFNIITSTVEKTNDGFQTVGKKKKKGKSKSTNGGQFVGPSVKQNLWYEPKATTSAPKKGATNAGNASKSSSMLKTTGTLSEKGKFTTSNPYSALDDESEEDVENVYDEPANLFSNSKTGGSSSFKAAG
ncbi:zinc knuckle CX2CX4HX4C containing protein [Tanacetum coccineum]